MGRGAWEDGGASSAACGPPRHVAHPPRPTLSAACRSNAAMLDDTWGQHAWSTHSARLRPRATCHVHATCVAHVPAATLTSAGPEADGAWAKHVWLLPARPPHDVPVHGRQDAGAVLNVQDVHGPQQTLHLHRGHSYISVWHGALHQPHGPAPAGLQALGGWHSRAIEPSAARPRRPSTWPSSSHDTRGALPHACACVPVCLQESEYIDRFAAPAVGGAGRVAPCAPALAGPGLLAARLGGSACERLTRKALQRPLCGGCVVSTHDRTRYARTHARTNGRWRRQRGSPCPT